MRAPLESGRGSSRREVVLPCQVVREHDFKLIADRTLDISVEGMLLPLGRHAASRVLTGESLILAFAIPGLWIDIEATVARVVHGRRPGDDGLAVGVVFDRIAPSARAALAGFLHGRRLPLPRRGPLARLRRGKEAPQLADEKVILQMTNEDVVDVADVTNDDAIEDEAPVAPVAPVDGLGILRAVLGAWQNLLVENGAANAE